jgi:hypothetical protein
MNNSIQNIRWSESVILVDADYVDKVAFNLIVNFERMLGRRIPQADLAKWMDCVALDGGIRPGENDILVVLIHQKDKTKLENFKPSDYVKDIDGKAFRDHLGEFSIGAYPIEDIAGSENYFSDALQLIAAQKEVKRIMVVPNAEDSYIYNNVRAMLKDVDDEKRITLLSMQPMPNWNFRQEILGYSLLAALGISSEEINSKS